MNDTKTQNTIGVSIAMGLMVMLTSVGIITIMSVF
jgi:hypothetical protein